LEAAHEACQSAVKQLAGAPADLVCVFASPIYRTNWPEALALLQEQLKPSVLVGCSGGGIIGGTRECEAVPALSVVAAHLPDVKLHPFAVTPDELERSEAGGFWVDKVGAMPDQQPVFILCVDPYTCEPTKLLAELNATYPKRPVIGGLASGGTEPGHHALFFNGELLREGAVGVAMSGNLAMDTVVAQGCRPIGRPVVITKSEETIMWELGGRPALEVLRDVLMGLPASDQALAQRAIFVGLVVNEMKPQFGSGDFLIRQVTGIDPPSGAIAVAEHVQVGQTVQFHILDPGAAREELRGRLAALLPAFQASPPAGALVFNCLGRGKSLYGVSNHDIRIIRTIGGKLPVGGFFCNGEIGPIGGVNFLHGFTASVGLFRPSIAPPTGMAPIPPPEETA
jgi:small ligand-binding sensory domain FIST